MLSPNNGTAQENSIVPNRIVAKAPDATLDGTAAQKSAQGKVALAFLKAAHKGDAAAIKKLVTAANVEILEGPTGKEMIDIWKMGTDPQTAKVAKVDITGETAVVTIEWKSPGSRETAEVMLEREKKEWKVSSK